MKKILPVIFLFSFYLIKSQDGRLIEKERIKWKDYPEVFNDVKGKEFKSYYQALEKVEMFEVFYESDGLKIQAFLSVPKEDGTYPIVIYNRGGNRNFGALSLLGREKYTLSATKKFSELSARGFVVIGCNYRGGGKSEGMEEFGGQDLNDVFNIIRLAKTLPKADSTRIGMYGWSRGGMMTYLTLLQSDEIMAAVTGGAPSDLTIIDRPRMETHVYSELIPGYESNKGHALESRSIVYQMDKFPIDVPILLLHGSNDKRVNPSNSLNMASELNNRNLPYSVKVYDYGDHALTQYKREVLEEVERWFKKYLK